MKTLKQKFIIGMVITLFLVGLGFATTVISDTQISTPRITNSILSNISFFSIGGFERLNLSRQGYTTEPITKTVCSSGCDYTTIQSALNDVPEEIRHKYTIQIKDGTYNENVFIPPTYIKGITSSTEGSYQGLIIQGNLSNINGVKVKSFHVSDSGGAINPTIQYLTAFGNDTVSDEMCSICIYGAKEASINYINFSGQNAKVGVMAYSAGLSISGNNYVGGNLEWAVLAKHNSMVYVGDTGYATNVSIQGTTSLAKYTVSGGSYINVEDDNITSPNIANCQGGLIFNDNSNTIYCAGNLGGFGASIRTNDTILINQSNNQRSLEIQSNATTSRVFTIESVNTDGDMVHIRNNGVHTDPTNAIVKIVNDQTGSTNPAMWVQEDGHGAAIKISGNVTYKTCDANNKGGIYYDDSTSRHYGCNSTTWNALY